MGPSDKESIELRLQTVHRRVSVELLDLQKISLDIERDLQETISASGMQHSAAARRRLQELDRLSQTLGCLGAFLEQTSESIPRQIALDMRQSLSAIHLKSVADRLAHGTEECSQLGEASSVELFN